MRLYEQINVPSLTSNYLQAVLCWLQVQCGEVKTRHCLRQDPSERMLGGGREKRQELSEPSGPLHLTSVISKFVREKYCFKGTNQRFWIRTLFEYELPQ